MIGRGGNSWVGRHEASRLCRWTAPLSLCVLILVSLSAAEVNLNEELVRTILMGHPSRYDTAIIVDEKAPGGVRTEPIPATLGSIADLIKQGADPNARGKDGTPILMLAVQYGHWLAAKELIEGGADVNATDAVGRNPLHLAVTCDTLPADFLDLLIQKGVNVNAPDQEMRFTPLMHAVMSNRLAAVKWLMEHGADPEARSLNGKRALTLAREMGLEPVAQFLENPPKVESSTSPMATTSASSSVIHPEVNRPADPSAVATNGYFTLPDDSAFLIQCVPPAEANELVAMVGEGGVTRKEWERSMEISARMMADDGSARRQMSKQGESGLSEQEKSNALWNAIDEELLFQGAIADGVFNEKRIQDRVSDQFYQRISALPELKRQDSGGVIQFRSMTAPDLTEFTEDRIQAYYQSHQNQFQAPIRVQVSSDNMPASADEEGYMATRSLNEIRSNPESSQNWSPPEWVTEGEQPKSVIEGPMEARELYKLFHTPKGEVTPILRGVVNLYVFRILDRDEKTGALPLELVRDRVLHAMARERLAVYNQIRKDDPERFYRMALQKGAHRALKGELGSRYLNQFYNPPPGRTREDVLVELQQKYPVKVLLKEPVYVKDGRKSYQQQQRRKEEAEMLGAFHAGRLAQARGELQPGETVPLSPVQTSYSPMKLITMAAFGLASLVGLILLVRFLRS